jgi:asparagine synthetase B (glutamine-hydrolysing)
MSGIVGIYNVDGRTINAGALKQMVDHPAHRGPEARACGRRHVTSQAIVRICTLTSPNGYMRTLRRSSNDKSAAPLARAPANGTAKGSRLR